MSYKLTKIIDVPFIIFLIKIVHSSNQRKISAYIKLVLNLILEYERRFDLELRRRSLKREMIDSMVDSLIDSASQNGYLQNPKIGIVQNTVFGNIPVFGMIPILGTLQLPKIIGGLD